MHDFHLAPSFFLFDYNVNDSVTCDEQLVNQNIHIVKAVCAILTK